MLSADRPTSSSFRSGLVWFVVAFAMTAFLAGHRPEGVVGSGATPVAQTLPEGAVGTVPADTGAADDLADDLGTRVATQYDGDGVGVEATAEGARVRAVFQQLDGRVASDGLWLRSTEAGTSGEPFRVPAHAVGRTGTGTGGADATKALARTGTVAVADGRVQFTRPGLVEEYGASVDGVRQDFLVLERPAGDGALRVELSVAGATAAADEAGVRLTLADSGREIVYGRLRVEDARGDERTARLEVVSPTRLQVIVDDAGAAYPVRIDPTFSDADWAALGTGVDNAVEALAVMGTDLYVGGRFGNAGGSPAARVAKWNGSAWSALGAGVGLLPCPVLPCTSSAMVSAMAVSGSDLYVGGFFETAGVGPGSSAPGSPTSSPPITHGDCGTERAFIRTLKISRMPHGNPLRGRCTPVGADRS